MRVISGLGVNELYVAGRNLLNAHGEVEDSRNGPVMVMPCPVTSVYQRPGQRVLLDKARGANPFFHMFEGLWMLAGRNDVRALNTFITDFGTRFAEEGGDIHGAYGHRWRKALGFDQLAHIVAELKRNPHSRQCVLQMWDAAPEHEVAQSETDNVGDSENGEPIRTGSDDLRGVWKDRPCNTHVYFRVRRADPKDYGVDVNNMNRDGSDHHILNALDRGTLDMTVLCRSNDIIFGAYGANAVHFSMLHEYVASMTDCVLGTMYQVSNNYHAYMDVLKRIDTFGPVTTYESLGIKPFRMIHDPEHWDNDLARFMAWFDTGDVHTRPLYHNPWFVETASPMVRSYLLWRSAMQREAKIEAATIYADDWRIACTQWFSQRKEKSSA